MRKLYILTITLKLMIGLSVFEGLAHTAESPEDGAFTFRTFKGNVPEADNQKRYFFGLVSFGGHEEHHETRHMLDRLQQEQAEKVSDIKPIDVLRINPFSTPTTNLAAVSRQVTELIEDCSKKSEEGKKISEELSNLQEELTLLEKEKDVQIDNLTKKDSKKKRKIETLREQLTHRTADCLLELIKSQKQEEIQSVIVNLNAEITRRSILATTFSCEMKNLLNQMGVTDIGNEFSEERINYFVNTTRSVFEKYESEKKKNLGLIRELYVALDGDHKIMEERIGDSVPDGLKALRDLYEKKEAIAAALQEAEISLRLNELRNECTSPRRPKKPRLDGSPERKDLNNSSLN